MKNKDYELLLRAQTRGYCIEVQNDFHVNLGVFTDATEARDFIDGRGGGVCIQFMRDDVPRGWAMIE